MALVRILIDGYSLLHNWPELAPGAPRHSLAAREELISMLRRYRDAIGTPISIIFDGGGAPAGTAKPDSPPELEVLFSGKGKTADDLIERVTHRLVNYGDVLVVTDDFAERDTVIALRGTTSGCREFIQQVHGALDDLAEDVKRYNQRENRRFQRGQRG